MNRREAYSKELLSAYLDGELTVEERRSVEAELERSPVSRSELQALQDLDAELKKLGRYRLDAQTSARILARIGALNTAVPEGPSSETGYGELLSAYLDGELDSEEQGRLEQQLRHSQTDRELLDEFRGLRQSLAALPTYRLDNGFADRVLQQIAGGDAGAVQRVSATGLRRFAKSRRKILRPLVWTMFAISAALFLMVLLTGPGDQDGIQLTGPDGVPSSAPPVPPTPGAEDRVPPPPPSEPTLDPQWTLVSAIGQNFGQKLVLVYEVIVTEEGVEQAAFSHLLRRHRIGFAQTMPVEPEEQADLLKHRFLNEVQVFGDQDEMDRVQLYLVTTTGRTADAIYMDLMSRPRGIGGFFLNLTTRDVHSRVLNRLCEASKVDDQMGQAVRLLANFGILSRTARNLGAFGAIRWVEPELLEPATAGSNGGEVRAAAGEIRPAEPVPADFVCELLFVVRELRTN